jgi:hypothetical protein
VSDDLFLREINVFTFNPGVDVALRTRRFERSVSASRDFDDALFGDGYCSRPAPGTRTSSTRTRFAFQVPPRIEARTMTRLFDDHLLVNCTARA